MGQSFTSVALPKMMIETQEYNKTVDGEENMFKVDLHVGSWIVSLFFLGTIAGCLTGGFFNQVLGPRRVFLFSSPVAALTWVMIAMSHRVWVVYLARIMAGFLFGTFQANGKVYNAEIAHPELRGSLGTMISNMAGLGALYTFVLGYFISSWRLVAWLLIAPSIMLGVAVYFAGTFWMYAGVMLVLIVYGSASIPENKGQSLVKTEDKMAGTSSHNNRAFEAEARM